MLPLSECFVWRSYSLRSRRIKKKTRPFCFVMFLQNDFIDANLTSFANLLFFFPLQNGRSHSRSASSLRCCHIAVHASHVCHQRRSRAESAQSVLMWPRLLPTVQPWLRWLSCSKPAERSCQDLSGSVASSLPTVKKCNFCSSCCIWHVCIYTEAAGLSQIYPVKEVKMVPVTSFSSCF